MLRLVSHMTTLAIAKITISLEVYFLSVECNELDGKYRLLPLILRMRMWVGLMIAAGMVCVYETGFVLADLKVLVP